MKKYLKIIFMMFSLFIISGCSNAKVIDIGYNKFDSLIKEKQNFILYIGSTSCDNCTLFEPKFESVVKKYNISNVYHISIDKLSDDERNEFYKIINITGTPTVAFIKDGEEKSSYNRIVGNVSKDKIINRLKSNDYIK